MPSGLCICMWTTGSLLFFRQQARDATSLRFDRRVLDGQLDRGRSHVVTADINRDRRPDIVALFAQEHETAVAYLNEGGGRFRSSEFMSRRIRTGVRSGTATVAIWMATATSTCCSRTATRSTT